MKTYFPLLAEYLGTFLITFVVLTTTNALVIGGIVTVILFLIGNISGGFINPAISYVMYLQSKLSFLEFFYYIAVQMLAALSSYTVYRMVA
jgi:glycerol uptake facilitator-like aquaporin